MLLFDFLRLFFAGQVVLNAQTVAGSSIHLQSGLFRFLKFSEFFFHTSQLFFHRVFDVSDLVPQMRGKNPIQFTLDFRLKGGGNEN